MIILLAPSFSLLPTVWLIIQHSYTSWKNFSSVMSLSFFLYVSYFCECSVCLPDKRTCLFLHLHYCSKCSQHWTLPLPDTQHECFWSISAKFCCAAAHHYEAPCHASLQQSISSKRLCLGTNFVYTDVAIFGTKILYQWGISYDWVLHQ